MSETRFFTCNLCEAHVRASRRGRRRARHRRARRPRRRVLARPRLPEGARAPRALRRSRPAARAAHPSRRRAREATLGRGDEPRRDPAARGAQAHGKDAVALYVGNPSVHTHRGALAAQLLTTALGTKNRFDPNSQDSNPRLFACMQIYGDVLSMPVPDVDRTDYLFDPRRQPGRVERQHDGPRRARRRASRRSASAADASCLIDPRRTETAAWCTSHHFIRPGGDAALLARAAPRPLRRRARVAPNVERARRGIAELRALCNALPAGARGAGDRHRRGRDPRASRASSPTAKRAAVYSRVGVCQNEFGPVASWLVEALNVVTGHFDREGGVMFPTPAADVGAARAHARRQPLGPLALARARPARVPRRAAVGRRWPRRWRRRGTGRSARSCASPATRCSRRRTARASSARSRSSTSSSAIDFYVNETTRHAHVRPAADARLRDGQLRSHPLALRGAQRRASTARPSSRRTTTRATTGTIASELARAPRWPVVAPVLRTALAATKVRRSASSMFSCGSGPYRLSLRDLERAGTASTSGRSSRRRASACARPTAAPTSRRAPLVADVPRVERWVDAHRRDGGLVLIGRRHLRSNNSWMHNLPSLAKGPDRARLLMHPDDAARLALADGGACACREPRRRSGGARRRDRRHHAGRRLAAARLRPRARPPPRCAWRARCRRRAPTCSPTSSASSRSSARRS